MPRPLPRRMAAALGAASLLGLAMLPATASDPMPLGQTDGWRLVFSDEFDGEALNDDKWVRCYWWDDAGCTNLGNQELQWYLPGNIAVSDGALTLTARAEVTEREEATYAYSSGIVTTGRDVYHRAPDPKFEFQYGYAEMRARIPAGRGLWPAFWLLPSDHKPLPEIDVMEVIGQNTGKVHFTLHYSDADGERKKSGKSFVTDDLSAGWHTFAVDWSPERIVWYVDGIERWRYDNAEFVPQEMMYLIVNLAVGGRWPGPPDAETQFPADYVIDYIRVWQTELP